MSSLPIDPECSTQISVWAEKFLVHPETGRPLQLHQVQRDLLDEQDKRCVTRGHRRLRATSSIALKALGTALLQPETRVLIYAPYLAALNSLFAQVRALINHNEWLGQHRTRDRQSPQEWVEFSNGSVIQGATVSRSQGALRGQCFSRGFVDSAEFVAESEWDALLPCVTAGTLEVFGVPPTGPTHSTFFKMCTDPKLRGAWKRRHIPVWDNPDLDPAVLARIRSSCSIDEWRSQWLAEFHPLSFDIYLNLPQPQIDPEVEAIKRKAEAFVAEVVSDNRLFESFRRTFR